jgi:hypothetical protein
MKLQWQVIDIEHGLLEKVYLHNKLRLTQGHFEWTARTWALQLLMLYYISILNDS